MKYGNISEVMVFNNETVFNKAVKILKEAGNGFENSGYLFALNFYSYKHYSFPYAQADLGIAGIKEGEDYKVIYR
jgi:hypothetical protein